MSDSKGKGLPHAWNPYTKRCTLCQMHRNWEGARHGCLARNLFKSRVSAALKRAAERERKRKQRGVEAG